jgi:hypothetical protein
MPCGWECTPVGTDAALYAGDSTAVHTCVRASARWVTWQQRGKVGHLATKGHGRSPGNKGVKQHRVRAPVGELPLLRKHRGRMCGAAVVVAPETAEVTQKSPGSVGGRHAHDRQRNQQTNMLFCVN